MSTTNSQVQSLYVAYFGRPADPAGLNFWTQTGTNTLQQQSNAFATAPEWTSSIAGMTNDQIVNLIYINSFGRAPEAAGLRFWSDAITNGTLSVGTAAWNIVTNTGPADKIIVDSKIAACTGYTANVAASTTDSVAYGNSAAFASANGWLDAIQTPAQATAALVPATLDASLAAMVTASNNSSAHVFNLTTGIDASGSGAFLAGQPTGNATINALDNAAGAATWTPLDNITASGTGNTFTVATAAPISNPAGSLVTGVQTMNLTQANSGASTILDTTGFTGLTQLTVTTVADDLFGSVAVTNLNAAATTNVTLISTAANLNVGALTVNGGNNVSVTAVGDNIVIGSATVAAGASPAGAIVVNETLTGAATTSVFGGTSVNITETGVTATGATITVGSATVAPTGAVTINNTAALAAAVGNAIFVTGGTVAVITSNISNTNAAGAGSGVATVGVVTLTGSAITTSVSVTQTAALAAAAASTAVANTSSVGFAATKGIANGGVVINDLNAVNSTTPTVNTLTGTLATVTLANFGAATISSAALSTLNLSGTGTSTVFLLGGTAASVTAHKVLALGLGGGSVGTITDGSNQITTINAALTADTTVTSIADTALRTLALTGTGVLTIAANTALTSITLAGAAGLNSDISGTGVTTLTAAGTTGAVTVTLNAANQVFTGGTGRDIVTIGQNATKVITGGSGATDRLILSATAATYLAATNTNVTGFEQLIVTNATGGIYNMAAFTGFNVVGVNAAGSTTTFSNVATGTRLDLESATTSVIYQSVLNTSSVAVNLVGTALAASAGGGTAGYITTALTLNDINSVGLAGVTINSDASVFQGLHTINTLTDSNLSSLTITGTGSLSIGTQATTATSLAIIDNGTGASTTADGIVSLTSNGNVLGSINYSGTHAFTIGTLTDDVANLAINNANTGTTGVLTVAQAANTSLVGLTLTGSVAYTLASSSSASAVRVTGGTDNANVSLTLVGAGIKTITLGNGADTVITGSAADVITLGTGGNSVTGAAAGDTITLGAGTAASTIVYATTGDTILGTVTSGTTALTAAAGADVITGLQAGDILSFAAYTANLYTAGALGTTLNGATGGIIEIVRGNYVASSGLFTTSSTGLDSIVQVNNLGSAGTVVATQETVVLVGFVNTASTTTIDGVITLA